MEGQATRDHRETQATRGTTERRESRETTPSQDTTTTPLPEDLGDTPETGARPGATTRSSRLSDTCRPPRESRETGDTMDIREPMESPEMLEALVNQTDMECPGALVTVATLACQGSRDGKESLDTGRGCWARPELEERRAHLAGRESRARRVHPDETERAELQETPSTS